MKSAINLRAEAKGLNERVQAIVAVAQKENRELTSDESKEVDQILDHQLPQIQSDLERAMKIESNVQAALGGHLDRLIGSDPANASGSVFRSHSGEVVQAYAKDDKLSSKPLNGQLGELVSAMALGPTRDTSELVRNALSTKSSGGDLAIPDTLFAGFLDLARARSVMMANGCQTLTMDAPEVRLVSVLSDPTITEKAEMASWTATDTVLGQVRLQSHTIGAVIECSREWFEDAPNGPQMIEQVLASALAAKLDSLALTGSGSGEMTGLTVNANVNSTGSIGTLSWSELSAAATAVRSRNHEPNAAILNTSIRDGLLLSADTTNQWIPAPPTLAGVNIDQTTAMTSSYGIVGDFTRAVWGIRKAASLEATTGGTSFEKHSVRVKIVFRGDFGLLYPNAFHRLEGIS